MIVALHVSAVYSAHAERAFTEFRRGDFCAAAEATGTASSVANPHVAEHERGLATRSVDHEAQQLICQLHKGVVTNDAGLVDEAIGSGVDVNGHVDTGMTTAMIEAAGRKSVDVVAALLANGASVEAADVAGWTPLHYALAGPRQDEPAQSRRRESALLLLERKPPVNAASAVVGWTPLLLAAAAGDPVLVKALLEAGAEPNRASRVGGWTPLFLAERERHEAVVSLLRSAGAVSRSSGRDHRFPLHIAGSQIHWDDAVYAIPGFLRDDGYIAHADANFTESDAGERLVFEGLGFSERLGRQLSAVGFVNVDGDVQVLWAADGYRTFAGLCKDGSSGLDHAMFREGSSGTCCGPVAEFWHAAPDGKTLRLAYAFEDTDTDGPGWSDSLAWPEEAGLCRWPQHRAAVENVVQTLSNLQVGKALGFPSGGPIDRTLPSRAVTDEIAVAAVRTLRALPEEFASVDDASSARWEVVAVARSARGADGYHGTDGALLVRDKRDGGWRSIYDCGNVTVEGIRDDSLTLRIPVRYGASETDDSPCSPGLGRSTQIDLPTLHIRLAE